MRTIIVTPYLESLIAEYDRLTEEIAAQDGEGYADLVEERDEIADEIAKAITEV